MKLSHEEISVRAYELWEAYGRPEKDDLWFWFLAENRLNAWPEDNSGDDYKTSELDKAKPKKPHWLFDLFFKK